MAPITDCLKKGEFNWSHAATKAFIEIKKRMVSAPVMRLPDFSKVFEVACDTLGIGKAEFSLKKVIQLHTSVRN